jgi:hypothetical protein
MTTVLATAIWWWFLAAFGMAFGVVELGMILLAHLTGRKNIQDWTLSDTIRRWSALHRWVAPVVCGFAAMLLYHFFGQGNL